MRRLRRLEAASRSRCNFIQVTLVLSLITESWALQVSDRKLVWLGPNDEIVRKDDERNKAVVYGCARAPFATSCTSLAAREPAR